MSDHCKGASDKLVTLGPRRPPEYWKSLEERSHGPSLKGEVPGGLPPLDPVTGEPDSSDEDGDGSDDSDYSGTTRRDFMTIMGFSVSAAALAACRAPEQKAIPMAVASDELVPGVANYYATTCNGCASACS